MLINRNCGPQLAAVKVVTGATSQRLKSPSVGPQRQTRMAPRETASRGVGYLTFLAVYDFSGTIFLHLWWEPTSSSDMTTRPGMWCMSFTKIDYKNGPGESRCHPYDGVGENVVVVPSDYMTYSERLLACVSPSI